MPAGHGVHDDEFTADTKPSGQALQAREPTVENVPGIQVWHPLEPACDANVPGAHEIQDRLLELRL